MAAAPVSNAAFADPVDAAVLLTQERVRSFAAGDAAALVATTQPGSSAAEADADTVRSLRSGSLDFEGLALVATKARVVREVPGGAVVEVTSELGPYSVGRSGATTKVGASTAVAVLKLALTQRGWRVVQILPQP